MRLDVAVIEVRPGDVALEDVGLALVGVDLRLGRDGRTVVPPGLPDRVNVDGVGTVVIVLEGEFERLALVHAVDRTRHARREVVGLPGPHFGEFHRPARRLVGHELMASGDGPQRRPVILVGEVDDLGWCGVLVVGQRPVLLGTVALVVGVGLTVVTRERGQTAGEGTDRTRTGHREDSAASESGIRVGRHGHIRI